MMMVVVMMFAELGARLYQDASPNQAGGSALALATFHFLVLQPHVRRTTTDYDSLC